MPAVYQKLGVRLLYPENWSITDEETYDWPRTVTLQSPETSFWTLHVFPAQHNPQAGIDEVVGAIRQVYEDLEVLRAEETYGDTDTDGVDIAFFYLDLLVEAKIRTLRTPSAMLVWHYQAESREFDRMEPVFQAITTSMLAGTIGMKDNE
jgi:hypothetical protein